MFTLRDDIQYELTRLNTRLANDKIFLRLQLVGGAALIMNGITTIETEDMDTIIRITSEIREVLDDLSIDINDDATDYVENYRNRNFIYEDEMVFSNIDIEYLDLPDTILTKMQYIDDEYKMEALEAMLVEELGIEIERGSIIRCLDYYGHSCDTEDLKIIDEFLHRIYGDDEENDEYQYE